MTAQVGDEYERVIRLAGVAETILPIRHTTRHTVVEIFVPATKLKEQ